MISDEAIEAAENFGSGKSLHDKRLILETLEFIEAEGFMVAPEDRAVITRDAGAEQRLPVPRLQLRWATDDGDNQRICHYELILPLSEYDIRRERARDGDKASRYLAVPLGCTRVSGGSGRDPVSIDNTTGNIQVDRPYRDGSHASWDAYALRVPLFAVWNDTASEIEAKAPPSIEIPEKP